MNLIGKFVPFLLGVPSVKAKVIGVSPSDEYILHQMYETQNKEGEWICVENYYYRPKYFINAYWFDTFG